MRGGQRMTVWYLWTLYLSQHSFFFHHLLLGEVWGQPVRLVLSWRSGNWMGTHCRVWFLIELGGAFTSFCLREIRKPLSDFPSDSFLILILWSCPFLERKPDDFCFLWHLSLPNLKVDLAQEKEYDGAEQKRDGRLWSSAEVNESL